MKKTILHFVLVSCVLFPVSSLAKWDYKKVQSVNECSECHEEEVEVWKETKHFKTFKRFSQDKDAKKIAKKMGVKRIKKADTLCTNCHYTVGNKGGKKKVVSGISCESCHAPSADWINDHSDYGGKGVKKNQETPAHKKARYEKLEKLGMIRPSNIYGWAKNCYNCHIVAKEKLVNKGGHKAGSDFKLFKRSQDKILHTDKATGKKADLIKLIGYAVELEMSLRAVGEASGGNKYSDKMVERAQNALANLKKQNGKSRRAEIGTVIAMASSAGIKAGNAAGLNPVADAISVAARIAVEDEMGYRYAKLDRSKLKVAAASKPAAAPKPAAKPAPKPAAKPVAKPASKPAPVEPKVVTRPKPAPAPAKPVQLAKATPAPAAVARTQTFTKSNFIDTFELVAPRNNSLCNTMSPWMLGERKINSNDKLSDDSCIGMSVTSNNNGWLYLFAETKNGELVKLLPNSCASSFRGNSQVQSGVASNSPLDNNNQESILSLKSLPGATGFYAVVVDTAAARDIVEQQTGGISDVCANNPTAGDIQNTLSQLVNQTEGRLDWKHQRFFRQ